MKRLLIAICFIAGSVHAQDAMQSSWLDPSITGIDKELPRTALRPYASQSDAIARPGGDTPYIREIVEWRADGSASPQVGFTGEFIMPFAWIDRQMLLRVPCADGPYMVSVNGEQVGYSQQSHATAEFDITPHAREGANRVQITVIGDSPSAAALENYTRSGAAPSQSGTLSDMSAIVVRPPAGVCVLAQPRIRVRDLVWDTSFAAGDSYLQLGVVVKSHLLNVKQVRVHYELLSPEGRSLSTAYKDTRFEMRDEDTVTFFERIPAAKAWSAASPSLYTLVVKLQSGGRYTEYVAAKIGFRAIGVSDGAFVINGEKEALKIAEFTPSGELNGDRQRIEALKQGGTNTLRLLPHPQSEVFYSMCDSVGIYLIDQVDVDTHLAGDGRKIGGNPSNDPAWVAAFVDRAKTAYHCSQTHPSVVAYSLAENSSNGFCLYESYRALKALQTSHPVIYLDARGEWNSDADPLDDGSILLR